jgi:hypothetical protein
MEQAVQIAGAALENALNSLEDAAVQIAVAEMFVVLGSNFLRAVSGEEYTRQFLQNGIDQLDHPAVVNVIHIEEHEAETKH